MSIPEKKKSLSTLINELGFFVSRSGRLHKISSIIGYGDYLKLSMKCGQCMIVRNSRRSKAARWLKNKWMKKPCKSCKINAGDLLRFTIKY
ncbi:MAG: pyrrolysine--tRNA(Pyl) ligase small subunit [Nitrososphaerales archaeon]